MPREYEELLKPARLRALLRALDSAAEVVLDAATRNYYVRVCA